MTKKNTAEIVAKYLLEIEAVKFRFNPPFTYTTGIKSPIYTDNRRIISFPEVRRKIVNYYFELMANNISFDDIDYVSGTATAGIPMAAFIADKLDIPMIYVRSSSKKHGLEQMIEGYLQKGSKVVVIEDMYSTGTSALHNAKVIREAGGIVDYSIAIMNYGLPGTEENFAKNKIIPLVLTSGKIIFDIAMKEKILSPAEKRIVSDWLKDPQGWAKRHGFV